MATSQSASSSLRTSLAVPYARETVFASGLDHLNVSGFFVFTFVLFPNVDKYPFVLMVRVKPRYVSGSAVSQANSERRFDVP